MAALTCGCGVGNSDMKCRHHAARSARAVTAAVMGGFYKPVRCDAVSPLGNQCRGLAGHLDAAPLGRHYHYEEGGGHLVLEEWR